MNIAFCFDGQGKHEALTMQRWIKQKPDAEEWLQKINEILPFDIFQVLSDECMANKIEYMQTISFIWNQMIFEYYTKKYLLRPKFVFGHSLGHYNALVSAGVLSFEEVLQLVVDRASLIAKVFGNDYCGMVHVKYSDAEHFSYLYDICQDYCTDDKTLQISILNSEYNVIVSYSGYSRQQAEEILKNFTVKPLAVRAPYHSIAMEAISAEFYELLEPLSPKSPKIPVISNVIAKPVSAEMCKKDLMRHLTDTLQMDACMRYLSDQEVDTCVHFSLTNIVPALLAVNCPESKCYHLVDPDQEQAFHRLTEADDHENIEDEYRKILGEFSTIPRFSDSNNIACIEIRKAMTNYQNREEKIDESQLISVRELYEQTCKTL